MHPQEIRLSTAVSVRQKMIFRRRLSRVSSSTSAGERSTSKNDRYGELTRFSSSESCSYDGLNDNDKQRRHQLDQLENGVVASPTAGHTGQCNRRPHAGRTSHPLCSDDGCWPDEESKRRETCCWRNVPGRILSVRSIDYLRHGTKAPSIGELYECLAVDCFTSTKRLPNMSSRVVLPNPSVSSSSSDRQQKATLHAPEVFVITLSIPRDATDSGNSLTITMYFGMKETTRKILEWIALSSEQEDHHQPLDPKYSGLVPAVRLLDDWCRRAPSDHQFRGRFKLIPLVQEREQIIKHLPPLIARYSGRPILIKRSDTTGFVHVNHDTNCLEMEISFHPFPWAAKMAFQHLQGNLLHRVILTLGFVIEGREQHELPEVPIGLCQLCFPHSKSLPDAADFFGSFRSIQLTPLYSGSWSSECDE